MLEPLHPKLVILDRDGVINEDSDAYIKSPEEWHAIPGSLEAIARLTKAGFQIAVATNQSGLGRAFFTDITLANIHNLMRESVEQLGGRIDVVCYCPHHPDEHCDCRKPLPGLLNQIEAALSVSVKNAWFVGDSFKDVQTALAKDCKPISVRTGKGFITEATLQEKGLNSIPVFNDLAEACDFILSQQAKDTN